MPIYEGKNAYDFDTDSIWFHLREGEAVLKCSISREALQDHFGPEGAIEALFSENEDRIVAAASAKHVANKLDPDGWARLRTTDKI
ncbi:MAG: DUF1488 family protein [Pseudomonadota bacterium]